MMNVKMSMMIIFAGAFMLAGCDTHRHKIATNASCLKGDGKAKPVVIELKKDNEYQPLLTGMPLTCGMRSGRVCLEPGKDCGEHTTGGYEEMLVFLSGSGVAVIEQKTQLAVGAGKVAYMPPFTEHYIKNTGKEPLIYIYCVSPVPFDANEQRQASHQH